MSGLISRQAAIDAVHEEFDDCLVWDESGQRTADEFEIIIDRLPSAEVTLCHLDGPCEYQNADIAMPSAQSEKETCKDCKWENAFGYGECYHCKRMFEDMWEEKDNE